MKSIFLLFSFLIIELALLLIPQTKGVFEYRDDQIFEQELAVKEISYQFSLDDYYSDNKILEELTQKAYESLSTRQRVAELLMPAVGTNGITKTELRQLIDTDSIGGFMLLGKGVSKQEIAGFKDQAKLYKDVPLFSAIDAEPSLIKYRLPQMGEVAETGFYTTQESVSDIANRISLFIKEYGFSINFAPVYDINANQAVIGSRSHGPTTEIASSRANVFTQSSMDLDVIPTAKHFPGHGAVVGDSHKLLPIIDSDLVELDSFAAAIDVGIPMIMMGHLAVEGGPYDTGGLPATLSPVIQKNLLRDEMGFRGVIITDAFNMHALKGFSNNEINSLKAGADIILMPQTNINTIIKSVLEEANRDPVFAKELEQKVKRVLRLKLSVPQI